MEKISQRLDEAMLSDDAVEDYWDKLILLPLEPFIEFDDVWMDFLDKKAMEYSNVLVPTCERIIRDSFAKIGAMPREEAYSLIRTEFILVCMSNIDYEEVRISAFSEMNEAIKRFFEPIARKAVSEAERNQEALSGALKESQSLWQYHTILYNYSQKEEGKLRLRIELDEKYTPILLQQQRRWEDSVTDEQRQQFAGQQVSLQASPSPEYSVKQFLMRLTPAQYALLERQLYHWQLLQQERHIFSKRQKKYEDLVKWLDENRTQSEASYNREMEYNRLQAARMQTAAMMLIGISSMVNAYANWQNTYYNSYAVVGGHKNFQLYDQFGRYYYGTIR
ncbi:MAG: hypothetical protein SWH78_16580 [Thermodesulfobacteriota bacterium]|nr:hypothetical protein [Thermodesulfobacteriota bacterium]